MSLLASGVNANTSTSYFLKGPSGRVAGLTWTALGSLYTATLNVNGVLPGATVIASVSSGSNGLVDANNCRLVTAYGSNAGPQGIIVFVLNALPATPANFYISYVVLS